MLRILPVLILLSGFMPITAQRTIVQGRVIDAQTSEPLAFANVYFKGTHVGTVTDFEGHYSLETDHPGDSLAVSVLGYREERKVIEKGRVQVLNFSLYASSLALSEVVVVPGENPAHELLRKVWANRDKNNIERLDQYSLEAYAKTEVYLRTLGKEPRDIDSTSIFARLSIRAEEGSEPALPIYMNEASSDVHYLRYPKREKVLVKASRSTSLFDAEEISMLTGLFQKAASFNFYDNYVRLLERNFVSPVSTAGLFYYKYYLVDSLYIDGRYCYELRVVPKRSGDLTFNGTVWINDTTFAVKRLALELGKDANINFIDRIRIRQDMEPVEGGAWLPVKTRVLVDAVNIFLSNYVEKSGFEQTSYPVKFFDTELEVLPEAEYYSDEDWERIRPRQLDRHDLATISSIESLRENKWMRTWGMFLTMAVKGYYNVGYFDLGPWLLLYNYNDVEGHRFRVGGRTTPGFDRDWVLSGYAAYGTEDKHLKYELNVERFLARRSWTKLGVQYRYDVERMGAEDVFYSQSSFGSFASSFGGTDKMMYTRIARAWFETDLFKNFTQKLVFMNKTYTPASPDLNFAYYTDEARSRLSSDMSVSEVNLTSIYQPRASFIVDKNNRFPVSLSNAPVYTLSYTYGFKGVFGSDFEYHKLMLGIRQNILLGSVGSLSYNAAWNKVYSPLPYPLLTLFHANESWFRTANTFNMIDYGEFVADNAATLFLTFRQDGFILDRLPLIKKLRWRSVATASVAWGSFDEARNGFYDPLTNPGGILPRYKDDGTPFSGFRTLSWDKPYMEVSYGIENIFSFFRVEAFHRLSYLQPDSEGDDPRKFGIKLSAVFRF